MDIENQKKSIEQEFLVREERKRPSSLDEFMNMDTCGHCISAMLVTGFLIILSVIIWFCVTHFHS